MRRFHTAPAGARSGSVDPCHTGRSAAAVDNPGCMMPRDGIEREFKTLVQSIERPEPFVLLDVVLRYDCGGASVRERFLEAPYGSSGRSAAAGTLLQHSLKVAQLALHMAEVGPVAAHIDRSMLTVCALLHDIGKIDDRPHRRQSFCSFPPGLLLSHTCRGTEIVGLAVAETRALHAGVVLESDLHLLQHVISSHHGTDGSPMQPRTLEALLVQQADLMWASASAMIDRIETSPMDAHGWVHPVRRGQTPLWHFVSAVDPGTMTDTPVENGQCHGLEVPNGNGALSNAHGTVGSEVNDGES